MADRSTAEAAPSTVRTQVVVEAQRIEEAALFSSKRHFEAARIWSWYHWIIGIPLVLFSALASSSYLDKIDATGQMATMLPVAVLILSALATFVDAQKRISAHQNAGNAYDSLLNKVRIFRTIGCVSESLDALVNDQLRGFSEHKDRLNETSPSTPFIAYLLAKLGLWLGQAEYAVDKAASKNEPDNPEGTHSA